jgi:hypothetical protein
VPAICPAASVSYAAALLEVFVCRAPPKGLGLRPVIHWRQGLAYGQIKKRDKGSQVARGEGRAVQGKCVLRMGSPCRAPGRCPRESWNATTAPGDCATRVTGEMRCAMEQALRAPRVAPTIGTARMHRFRLKLSNMGSSELAEPGL